MRRLFGSGPSFYRWSLYVIVPLFALAYFAVFMNAFEHYNRIP